MSNDQQNMKKFSESFACQLEVSDELISIIERNINPNELSPERVSELLRLMKSWTDVMLKEINLIEDKEGTVRCDTAIAEYDYWNDRYLHYKSLLVQLSMNKAIRKNVEILERITDKSVTLRALKNFKDAVDDIETNYRNVVKPTKHSIDTIREGIDMIINAPFDVILENITPLYNNLNVIWLTSSWFSRKKSMERLLELISNSIADRIATDLSVPDIFRLSTHQALRLIKNAQLVSAEWKTRYSRSRKEIEVFSNKYISRWAWTFDEHILFYRLNFVRFIVNDLEKIIRIVDMTQMSPEARHVFKSGQTGKFIKNIIKLFFELKINVYESNSKQAWKDTMEEFYNNFERYVYKKINRVMEHSRSSTKDFTVLTCFENMPILDDLKQKLIPKYTIVCEKFIAEIDDFRVQFQSYKSSPKILLLGMPPVAAVITLLYDLFLRVKRMARNIELKANYDQEQKMKALSEYKHFCEDLFEYANSTVAEWSRDALAVVERHIKRPLYYRPMVSYGYIASTIENELFSVMDTALHLHNLGYEIPDMIMNLVLRQEQIMYNKRMIDEAVNVYNSVIDIIDKPLMRAMSRYITDAKENLEPAFGVKYNYLSIKLPKFILTNLSSMQMFIKVYNEIESYEKSITEKLKLIENMDVFPIDFDNIQEIIKTLNRFKSRENENLTISSTVMSYIAEALELIENKCYQVKTGRHEMMDLLYEKYEHALFESLMIMVVNNFRAFKTILDDQRVAFIIHGRLVKDKFVFAPSMRIIILTFARALNAVLNKPKFLPRWLSTTNIRCPYVKDVATGKMHLPYSFYDHGVKNRQILFEIQKECYESIEALMERLEKTGKKLAKLSVLLEKRDKLILSQFAATNPTLDDYKDKLEFFSTLSAELKTQSHVDVGCIRICYSEYNDKLIERCGFWHSAYGNQLIHECDKIMRQFSAHTTTLQRQLNIHFRDCQGLDRVEKTIKKIKETVFEADHTIYTVQNKFHFLRKQKIIVPNDKLKQLEHLKSEWQILYEDALSKSFCFENAKKGLVKTSE